MTECPWKPGEVEARRLSPSMWALWAGDELIATVNSPHEQAGAIAGMAADYARCRAAANWSAADREWQTVEDAGRNQLWVEQTGLDPANPPTAPIPMPAYVVVSPAGPLAAGPRPVPGRTILSTQVGTGGA